jgi:hypothetical protein
MAKYRFSVADAFEGASFRFGPWVTFCRLTSHLPPRAEPYSYPWPGAPCPSMANSSATGLSMMCRVFGFLHDILIAVT